MRNFKIAIKFDIELLNKLKNNDNSGVEVHNRKHHLALHPIHLNDLNKSIKEVLSSGIAKYNKNLGGILLGYENIKLPVNVGLINYDSCYIHMDLEANFFVFKPEIGKEMQGVVNRKSKDHVGILVYNVFNVSLPKPQTDEDWLGSSINIGDEVLFRITYMNLSSYLPYIKGELISVISTTDDVNTEEKYLMNNKKRCNKKIIFDDNPSSEDRHKSKKRKFDASEEMPQNQQNTIPPLKKKKKHKNADELEETVLETQILIPQVEKKKKKHKNENGIEENVQKQQILVPQVQKKKKHKSDNELEENLQEQQISIPEVQKKKKHKSESGIHENMQEQQISVPHQVQKKRKHKSESDVEENEQEQQILVPHQVQKKRKHKSESEIEENEQEQQILVPHQVQKRKKHKIESELDEDTRSQKKSKKKKEKLHKEKGIDESSLTDFNLSELFNETTFSLHNIKTEIESDENSENSKSGKKKHFPKNLEKIHRSSEADNQNNTRDEKLKIKNRKIKQEMLEDSHTNLLQTFGNYNLGNNVSVNNIKYEHSDNDLETSINNSKSKKLKKKRNSFVELGSHNKKWKRESA